MTHYAIYLIEDKINRKRVILLFEWLDCNSKVSPRYINFDLIEICEKIPITSEIEAYLEMLFIEARLNLSVFQRLAQKLSWSKVRSLLSGSMPTYGTARKGFFGEVLLCALLKNIFGYIIPVQKSRYTITKDQTLPGADIIAIKTNQGTISEVCFVESKLRTTEDNGAAIQGYDQLKKYYSKEFPDMISFVLNRLGEINSPLFNDFFNYTIDRKDLSNIESFCLGLTWETAAWREKVLKKLEENIEANFPKLIVKRIMINNLDKTVGTIFKKFGVVELIDD